MKRRLILLYGSIFILAVVAGSIAGLLSAYLRDLPEVSTLEQYRPSALTTVYADTGEPIGEFYQERRVVLPLQRIPRILKQAVLAAEDARFYEHEGVDFQGILRALWSDLRARRIVEGGSTITQQLTRQLFLSPEKSLRRKVKEAVLSVEIESRYAKDEILGFYLNQVYFGSGAYGVEAAARTYFGKGVEELNLAEASLLAGLPKAPSQFSPFLNPERARERQRYVLGRMLSLRMITREQSAEAAAAPLPLVRPAPMALAAHFVEGIRQELQDKVGSQKLYRGGLKVYTTLDASLQRAAQEALEKGLRELERKQARYRQRMKPFAPPVEGALVAIDPKTGYIRALVGGRDFRQSQFNRATQALRQPGSAFKPFIYAAALSSGYSPNDMLLDAPVTYVSAPGAPPWRPENFDGKFLGPVPIYQALAESRNVPTVRLLEKVGPNKVIDLARRMGIHSPLQPYLSLALGSSDLTLMEITAAFAAFADEGIWIKPVSWVKITDSAGKILEESRTEVRDAIPAELAQEMTKLLQGVVEHGTGQFAKALGRPAFGKTGTTNDFDDAWFIGYSAGLVAGVWVGYDDHRSLGNRETGAVAAGPIWLDFMKEAVRKSRPPSDGALPNPGAQSSPPLPAAPVH